jgi:hypothetical protein
MRSSTQAAMYRRITIGDADVLPAVAPIAGSARVMLAAPRLAMALGYEDDAGLEGAHASEDGR